MHSLEVGLSSFLIFSLLFSPPMIAGQIAVNGLRSGSCQKVAAKPRMIFLRPASALVFPLTLFVWILMLCCFIVDPTFYFSSDWKNMLSHSGVVTVLFAAVAVAITCYRIISHWYKETCPLVLDLDQRTFRTVDTSSFVPKPRTGSWDEPAGILVRRSYAKGTTSFYVQLKLKRPKKFALSLGEFKKQDTAEAFAQRMAQETGLPLVSASIQLRE